jgi:nitroreductase
VFSFYKKPLNIWRPEMMETSEKLNSWSAFQIANRYRRAIRKFSDQPVKVEDVESLLAEASFAPSSGNMQPYTLHWIRDAELKTKVAEACNGQKAAATAMELIVIAASPAFGRKTAFKQLEHVEYSIELRQESKAYYRKQIGMFQRILGLGSSIFFSPIVFMATLINPALSLIPIGHTGSRHWAARNAIFAAQTLILGAAAKGIDSCPMEGFSASKVVKLLELQRGTVIPLIIALGYRAEDAGIEQQWRRSMTDIVIYH